MPPGLVSDMSEMELEEYLEWLAERERAKANEEEAE